VLIEDTKIINKNEEERPMKNKYWKTEEVESVIPTEEIKKEEPVTKKSKYWKTEEIESVIPEEVIKQEEPATKKE